MDSIEKVVIGKLPEKGLLGTLVKRYKAEMPIWAKYISTLGKTLTSISISFIGIDQVMHVLPENLQGLITTCLGYCSFAGFVLTIFANLMVKEDGNSQN